MRVLNSLVDPRIGGPHLRSLAVAKKLRGYGVETLFLLPDGEGEFEDLAFDEGFEVIRPSLPRLRPPSDVFGNAQYLLEYLPAIRRVCGIIDDNGIDVLHASMTMNFLAASAGSRSSTPVAWYFNDTSTPWLIARIAARMAKSKAGVIAVAADAVHEYFFSESVETRTIYPPVDTSEFDPNQFMKPRLTIRNELGIEDDVPIVGTVGNINPVKGHKYLLRAVDMVKKEVDRIAVPIVGKILNSRREYYRDLKKLRSKLDLEDTVQFVGQRSDIPRMLAGFDVFVLSSVREGCPMAVLEAMAMQKPVVTTCVGGTPEQVVDGKHGWLVPPKDPPALANAITDALTAPEERAKRGDAARKRVNKKFSLERCAEAHYQMYCDVINTEN